jgi:hypothetical protein
MGQWPARESIFPNRTAHSRRSLGGEVKVAVRCALTRTDSQDHPLAQWADRRPTLMCPRPSRLFDEITANPRSKLRDDSARPAAFVHDVGA